MDLSFSKNLVGLISKFSGYVDFLRMLVFQEYQKGLMELGWVFSTGLGSWWLRSRFIGFGGFHRIGIGTVSLESEVLQLDRKYSRIWRFFKDLEVLHGRWSFIGLVEVFYRIGFVFHRI
jgi:hypothetical protein